MATNIIKNIHNIPLDARINLCLKYAALDYKWLIRNYLTNCSSVRQKLAANDDRIDPAYVPRPGHTGVTCGITGKNTNELYRVANSAFDYTATYAKVFQQDPSLSAITEMCHDPALSLNVLKQDDQLYFLSRVFNEMAGSTRGLYKCYDCGTNARAMFLKLIQKHRGGRAFLSLPEQNRLRKEYSVYGPQTPESTAIGARNAAEELKASPTSCVMILSLGFDNFGHVWVIEKIVRKGQPARYHQYQSCFRSHMVIDFLEYKNYGADPEQSMDIDGFFKQLAYLFGFTGPWTNKEYAIFSALFAFLPVYPIDEGRPNFSYTAVIY